MARRIVVLAAAGCLALVPLGAASASSSTQKRIAYVSGGDLWTIAANGSSTTNLGESPNNPSISTDGQVILFDDGANVRSIAAGGPADSSSVLCAGTDPAISPDGTKVAFESGGAVVVGQLACGGASTSLGGGSDPAWSPDGTQIVFIDGSSDLAVAPSTGGAAQKLGTTSAVESTPSWSPDANRIAYVSDNELFVMNADGSSRQQLTSNSVAETSPSWAPGGDEIVYAAGGDLLAVTASGSSTRQLPDALGASQPSWGLAVANTAAPTITAGGAYAEGTQLSASQGSWTSISGISSYSYQWQRCGSAGTGCTNVGSNSGTYTLATGDIGGTIRVVVTAATSDGSAPGTSAATPVIGQAAPTSLNPPTITGTATVGQTLTASTGSWNGSNLVFTYQWQRCDLNGGSCANVSGATGNSFVPTPDDVNSTLRVTVTATNTLGAASRQSNPTAPVANNRPANTTLPSIAEVPPTSADDVTRYTVTTGFWTGSPTITFRYQWRRCDQAGAGCSDISSATLTSYTPAAADIGRRLKVVVTATNTFGVATVTTEPSNVVAGKTPFSTVRPTISGGDTPGSLLTSTEGDWGGSEPLSYTYEWRRCNANGDACTPIPGATATSYVVTGADIGSRIVVAVTARNALGAASIQSSPSNVIRQGAAPPTQATMPQSTRAPSFTGTLVRGRTLRAANGTWSGTTPIVFSYQWLRCPATGTTCTPISLATRATYVLAAADVGRRIRLRVTAGNAAGSTMALSAISKRVAARASAAKPKPRQATRGKTLNGTARADRLIGTTGADTIYGGAGNDRIEPRGGRDRVFGGAGNDTIFARDGAVDMIDCGAGRDIVYADRNDNVRNCEVIRS
jgi:hypothetical protein